jgi:hypothetical protein
MGLELSLSRVNFSVVISNEKKYKVKKSAWGQNMCEFSFVIKRKVKAC